MINSGYGVMNTFDPFFKYFWFRKYISIIYDWWRKKAQDKKRLKKKGAKRKGSGIEHQ